MESVSILPKISGWAMRKMDMKTTLLICAKLPNGSDRRKGDLQIPLFVYKTSSPTADMFDAIMDLSLPCSYFISIRCWRSLAPSVEIRH